MNLNFDFLSTTKRGRFTDSRATISRQSLHEFFPLWNEIGNRATILHEIKSSYYNTRSLCLPPLASHFSGSFRRNRNDDDVSWTKDTHILEHIL